MATPAYALDTRDARDGWAGTISRSVPWFLYAVLFASTSVIVGVTWDISWHRTIGRDTFWTPAHLGIYLGGIVAGLTCGWIALRLTFASGADMLAERAATVRFWGFRAPLGAWVCIWGAFAMLTSAPFDDWWHNSYGLDVKILSPPHALLAAGIGAIQCGAMLMAVAWQNRSEAIRERVGRLYLVSAGLLLVLIATLATEYIQRWDMHQSLFYMVSAGVFPLLLVSTARASVSRWPATITALVYMGFIVIMLLVLPLFRGEPLLGPIYVHVTHFVPPEFPLLLVAPALLIDLAMQRLGRGRDWRLSALIAIAFVVAFIAVQWPFADFLMTPWARNAIFVADRMDYGVPPANQARFFTLRSPDNLAFGLPVAVVLAFVSARCGLWWGNWMSRVQR
jgi:hypothetical protein